MVDIASPDTPHTRYEGHQSQAGWGVDGPAEAGVEGWQEGPQSVHTTHIA